MAQNIDLLPGSIDNIVLYDQKRHISEKIWTTSLSDKIKDVHNYDNIPEINDVRVLYWLNEAGFYGLYSLGYRKVDNHLITALIERWRPECSTFHFPSGELTMTLQYIEVLGGVKVDGKPLICDETGLTKNQRNAMINYYLGPIMSDSITRDGLISFKWLKRIAASLRPNSSMDDVIRVTRACMLLIIGSTYLQDNQGTGVAAHYLLYMGDLVECGEYSWGSAILAYLYRSLFKAAIIEKDDGKEIKGVTGALQLLQYWAWSRFIFMRSFYQEDLPGDDNPLPGLPTYPYGRRLAKCNLTYQMGSPAHTVRVFRDQFDQMSYTQIIWEPYPNVAYLPECSKAARAIWLAQVPLICTNVVEFHTIDRVMRQFGMRQTIPIAATRPDEVRVFGRKGRSGHNWVQRFAQHIATWNARNEHVQNGDYHGGTSADYMRWVTRRWIGRPMSQPPTDGPHPTAARMGLLVQEWNKKYERAVHRGNRDKIQKCLDMFTRIGIPPPVVEQAEMPPQQFHAEMPQQPPPDCYIPEPWSTGFQTPTPTGFQTPTPTYHYPAQNPQWSPWIQPSMPSFDEYQPPNPYTSSQQGPQEYQPHMFPFFSESPAEDEAGSSHQGYPGYRPGF